MTASKWQSPDLNSGSFISSRYHWCGTFAIPKPCLAEPVDPKHQEVYSSRVWQWGEVTRSPLHVAMYYTAELWARISCCEAGWGDSVYYGHLFGALRSHPAELDSRVQSPWLQHSATPRWGGFLLRGRARSRTNGRHVHAFLS